MESRNSSPWRKVGEATIHTASAAIAGSAGLIVPRRRALTKTNDASKATQRHSSVPSDLGPHGSAKHIQQNRTASGTYRPLSRRASEGFVGLKRALSRNLGSGLANSKAKTHGTVQESVGSASQDVECGALVRYVTPDVIGHDGTTPAKADLHGELALYHGPTKSEAALTNYDSQYVPLEICAEAFNLAVSSAIDTRLDCAGVLTFPVPFETRGPLNPSIKLALVLDNSAFSSGRTWDRIYATVKMLFAQKIITEADYLTVIVTQPVDPDGSVVREVAHYDWTAIEFALQSIAPSRDRPLHEQLDVAISRAMGELLDLWNLTARSESAVGHVIVLTANVHAVHAEFAQAAEKRKHDISVYVIGCNPVKIPLAKWLGESPPGVVKAKIGPNFTELDVGGDGFASEEWPDLWNLFRQIRGGSLPAPLENLTISLAVGAAAGPGHGLIVEDEFDIEKIGPVYPGEKVPFYLRSSARELLLRNAISPGPAPPNLDHMPLQHESAFDCLGKIHGKDVFVKVDYHHPYLSSIDGKITQYVLLGQHVSRNGDYNEPRAALFLRYGQNLYNADQLNDARDLLIEGTDPHDVQKEVLAKIQALIDEIHYSHGTHHYRQYTYTPTRGRPLPPRRSSRRPMSQQIDTTVTRRPESSFGGLSIPSSPADIGNLDTPESYRIGTRNTSAVPPSPLAYGAERRRGLIFARPSDDDSSIMVKSHAVEGSVFGDALKLPKQRARQSSMSTSLEGNVSGNDATPPSRPHSGIPGLLQGSITPRAPSGPSSRRTSRAESGSYF